MPLPVPSLADAVETLLAVAELDEVDVDAPIDDIDVDSLDLLVWALALERRYGFRLDEAVVDQLDGRMAVRDVFDLVASAWAGSATAAGEAT
jgi:acyl carrier protein